MMMVRTLMVLVVLLLFGTACFSTVMSAGAQVSSSSDQSEHSGDIKIEVTSSSEVHGVAGQIITIEGKVTNFSTRSSNNSGGIAYISIVDLADKVPVDLEDWSAEKGLYIPSIAAGQSLPLEWNVRLVKAGSYTIDILFNKDSDLGSPPIASSKIFMNVQPKFNLNPENILPVAFGVPAALVAVVGSINYQRGRKTGVYR
jgi:hypothetical protein